MSVRKIIEIIIGGRSELGGVVDKANADLGRLGKGVPGGGSGAGGGGAGGAQDLLKSTSQSLASLEKMAKILTTVEIGFKMAGAAAKALDGFSAMSAGNVEKAAESFDKLRASISGLPIAGQAFSVGQRIRAFVLNEQTTEEIEAEAKADVDATNAEAARLAGLARDRERRRAYEQSILGPTNAAIQRSQREIELSGMTPQQQEIRRLGFARDDQEGPLRDLYDLADARRDFALRDQVKKALELVQRSYDARVAAILTGRTQAIADEVNAIIDDVQAAGQAQLAEQTRADVNSEVNLLIADIYGPAGGRPKQRINRMGPLGATLLSGSYRGVGELFSAGLDPQAALVKTGEATARNTAAMVESIDALVNALRNGGGGPAPFNLSLR